MLLKEAALISIVGVLLVCSHELVNETNFDQNKGVNNLVSKKDGTIYSRVKVMISQLIAVEETRPPLGISPQPNRDIGFASIFISLENHQEINQLVTIQKVEIRNIDDNQSQLFAFKPRQIELKPLENSVIDIQLTNKTGYRGQGKVKAVVTYQADEQINQIESNFVEIRK